jgi:2'-hydroxyisoflavone reductase
MRLLVLGGTAFLGRHLVDCALARGHTVTVFNRGRTNPGLWPEVEEVRGDREKDLGALVGRSWDSVVDTSGYVPRFVRASAELLVDSSHYIFVSTISVYADLRSGPDETAPIAQLPERESENVQEHYGALKAACETVVEELFPARCLIVRPGLIVGPWDPTERFTYWPLRIARGGDVLVPEPRDARVQFIDARDLADWIVRRAELRTVGVFNATGPLPRPTMEEVLETCRRLANPRAELHWVDAKFLRDRGVDEFVELPLWVDDPDWAGFMDVEVSKAIRAGLTFRPIDQTVQDTLAWTRDNPDWEPSRRQGVDIPQAGMDPEREGQLIADWEARGRPRRA